MLETACILIGSPLPQWYTHVGCVQEAFCDASSDVQNDYTAPPQLPTHPPSPHTHSTHTRGVPRPSVVLQIKCACVTGLHFIYPFTLHPQGAIKLT